MMTADEVLIEARKRDREWAETEIGKLFYAFENAHGQAWAADTDAAHLDNFSADRRAKRAWEKASEARAAFLTILRGFP